MDRTEWPSSAKLEKLREAGEIPYSPLVSRGAAALAVLLGLSLFGNSLSDFSDLYASLMDRSAQANIDLEQFASKFALLLAKLVAFPLMAALSIILILGLLQTRFYVRASSASFDFSRLNRFGKLSFGSLITRPVENLISFCIAVALGFCLLYALLPGILTLLNRDLLYFKAWPSQEYKSILPGLILSLGILTFLAWGTSRIAFRWKHRMSRKELEAEGGED